MAKFEVGRIYKGSPYNYLFMCIRKSPNYVWLWDIENLIPDKVVKRKINTDSKKTEWSYGIMNKEIISAERLDNSVNYEHYLKLLKSEFTANKR